MSVFRRNSVSVARAQELLAEGWELVDVRSPQEWKAGHVATARNIPLDRLARSLGQLPAGASIVTICHSGVRSAAAARTLRGLGRTAVTVRGGMIAWRRQAAS
ncbi:rhodanese-like domain-containing protein [Pseudolysinimonas sp.]|uniref:rhodanese-like domain-containing protein n=1 Tax=Pseudolysinimonas sp. TaxID=2680009 RepID=UPI003F7F1321